MNTRVLTLAVALVFGTFAMAQEAAKDTTWKSGGLVGATLSQVSLTNWAAGGFSSISGNFALNLFANMKRGKNSWDNTLDLGYGLLKQGDDGEVQKTDDRIDLASKFGREAWNPKWYYSALANFRTQFTEGLDAPGGNRISDLLAPAYILGSLGLDYKPNDNFTVFISPVTAKFTIVNDDLLSAKGAFGVDAGVVTTDSLGVSTIVEDGSRSRSEFGGFLKAMYKQDIMENVNFTTKIDLFSNYQNPTYIDVNWDALIGMKVNDYINVTLGTTVLYDHDIKITDSDDKTGPRTQFRQIFGVGFAYKL
ncbi:MAG: DUF3078 domain-containing protein [Flavobacteriales bacterium]|nr:DUF3078 domain-containing protein [Flavobacteriales bacterium]NNK80576.1 DUF3078 domain-containing protein [Flavobacteriales bacterium]